MKILLAILLIFSHFVSSAIGRDSDVVERSINGKKLTEFIKKYTQTEIDGIAGGRCISITVPNSEGSDRRFYSLQLFLVKSGDGKEGSVDVFETTAGSNKEINLVMNITASEIRMSYVVFREQINDPHVSKDSKWVHTIVRLEHLVPALKKKS